MSIFFSVQKYILEFLRRLDGGLVVWVVILLPVAVIAWPERKKSNDWDRLIAVLKAIQKALN